MIKKLIFVYNANSGKINSLLDSAHKIVSPDTYDCKLCDLTYGIFKENEDWSSFREKLLQTNPNLQLEFLHKDEFTKQYKSKWLPKYDFPIILSVSDHKQDHNEDPITNSDLDVFMNTLDMNALETVQELIAGIETRLK